MRITVLGGTGYTGANIVAEAVRRGHQVISYSRSVPATPVAGVDYKSGSLLDDAVRTQAVVDADVVVSSLSPRGELEGQLEAVDARLAELAASAGTRFGVIGGFSSLRPAEGAPRFADGDDLPPQFAAEGKAMAAILEQLLASAPESLDWFFVSPAAGYGSHVPGEAKGVFRIGADVALFDANGDSAVSGADFATAVVDELEKPVHRRAQFSVAY